MRTLYAIFVGYLTVNIAIPAGAWAQQQAPNIVPLPGAARTRPQVVDQARPAQAPLPPPPPAKPAVVKPAAAKPAIAKPFSARPAQAAQTGGAVVKTRTAPRPVGEFVVPAPPGAASSTVELPGEKEFNSCSKIPAGRRILKLNLKPETEIGDLIGWISSITCTQFLISSTTSIQGKKVTIISPELITREEAYRLFLSALVSVGLAVEPNGKYLRILDAGNARFNAVPFYKLNQAGPHDQRFITRMLRVKHADATEVVNVLNRIKGAAGDIVQFHETLIVTDQAALIDRLEAVIKQLDVPMPMTEKIWMIRIKNTSAIEMANRIAEIFPVQVLGTGNTRPGPNGAPRSAPAQAAKPAPLPKGTAPDLASQMSITKIVPDERSNHLIVIANDQAYEWLRTMIKKLDVPLEGGGESRVHVYNCENANCDELAATLSAVAGVTVVGNLGARRQRTGAGGAPAPTPVTNSGQAGQQSQTAALLFENDVRITFDGATNSLLIVASLKDFQTLRGVIEKLDGPRKQVFVEALILEVLLDKSRKVGVSYHAGFPQSVAGQDSLALGGFGASKTLSPASLLADPALAGLSGALFGPAIPSSSTTLFGVTASIPSFGVLVSFLQENNDINVLSNPHLLITNNQEGEISVGQNLPFPGAFMGGGFGGQTGVGGFLPQVSVQRQDVALKMKLTPSVNEHDMIRLDVDQEISDVASPNYNGLGPATSKRTAKTQVVCRDQQTVVIGGLMSDRTTEHVTKVPVLGDIPVIGFFFRRTEKTAQKSNIIIALTPYVISDMSDLRRVVDKKMRERREFLERFSGINPADQNIEAEIDYRRKRGMLEEINSTAREIEDEEGELRRIRERDEKDDEVQITPPGYRGTTKGGPASHAKVISDDAEVPSAPPAAESGVPAVPATEPGAVGEAPSSTAPVPTAPPPPPTEN